MLAEFTLSRGFLRKALTSSCQILQLFRQLLYLFRLLVHPHGQHVRRGCLLHLFPQFARQLVQTLHSSAKLFFIPDHRRSFHRLQVGRICSLVLFLRISRRRRFWESRLSRRLSHGNAIAYHQYACHRCQIPYESAPCFLHVCLPKVCSLPVRPAPFSAISSTQGESESGWFRSVSRFSSFKIKPLSSSCPESLASPANNQCTTLPALRRPTPSPAPAGCSGCWSCDPPPR